MKRYDFGQFPPDETEGGLYVMYDEHRELVCELSTMIAELMEEKRQYDSRRREAMASSTIYRDELIAARQRIKELELRSKQIDDIKRYFDMNVDELEKIMSHS